MECNFAAGRICEIQCFHGSGELVWIGMCGNLYFEMDVCDGSLCAINGDVSGGEVGLCSDVFVSVIIVECFRDSSMREWW